MTVDATATLVTGRLRCEIDGPLSGEGVQLADLEGEIAGSGAIDGTLSWSSGGTLSDEAFLGSVDSGGLVLGLSFSGDCSPTGELAGDYEAEAETVR